MTVDEYRKERKRTESDEQSKVDKLVNFALGAVGETGECADLIKKLVFHKHPEDEIRTKLIKELGDCFWYIFGLMDLLNISFEEVLELNIEKLRKRYPDGFSSERSINRTE